MAAGQLDGVVRHLRTTALLQGGDDATDAHLLDALVARRDDAAFAALLRRHGPMVWGVCRRLLRNVHDAEDAFQAAFIVFVRKAASIKRRHLLGNWLYGTAYRAALEARAAARRHAREKQVNQMPQPAAPPPPDVRDDVRGLLDGELSRLPERYRVAIVLCDLEGHTRRQAARQLKVPEGTLSGRLTTARRLLAQRLRRRGLTLSGGALAATLAPQATACVPAALLTSTLNAALP